MAEKEYNISLGVITDEKSLDVALKKIENKAQNSKAGIIHIKAEVPDSVLDKFGDKIKTKLKEISDSTGKVLKFDKIGDTESIKNGIILLSKYEAKIDDAKRKVDSFGKSEIVSSETMNKLTAATSHVNKLVNELKYVSDEERISAIGKLESSFRGLNKMIKDTGATVASSNKNKKETVMSEKEHADAIKLTTAALDKELKTRNKYDLQYHTLQKQMSADPSSRTKEAKEELNLLASFSSASNKKVQSLKEQMKVYGQLEVATEKITRANEEYAISTAQVDRSGKKVKSFLKDITSGFRDAAARIVDYTIAYRTMQIGIQKIQESIEIAKRLDKALVDLQIVTGGTRAETEELLLTYNQMGREIGATTEQVAASANEFLRQGLTMEDTNKMIKASMYLSKLGMIDSASATEYLTSATKGYGKTANEVMSIVDKLTKVDFSAAVSAGYVAEAMARTSSSAKAAGVSMDELIGYIATVGEVTQKSASTVGESFNVGGCAA